MILALFGSTFLWILAARSLLSQPNAHIHVVLLRKAILVDAGFELHHESRQPCAS
jgi:hypothetical protein